jgi:hypothetical protein
VQEGSLRLLELLIADRDHGEQGVGGEPERPLERFDPEDLPAQIDRAVEQQEKVDIAPLRRLARTPK